MMNTPLVEVSKKSEIPPPAKNSHPSFGVRNTKTPVFSWTLLNFLLDVALFATFITLCWLAALTQFVFPSGSTGESWRLLGVSVEGWRSFGFWTLALFAAEVLIHIMLHWTWICAVFETRFLTLIRGRKIAGDDGSRTLIGVILLAATLLFMGIALGAAAYSMQRID